MNRRILLVLLLSCLALTPGLRADDHPNTARGFAADKAFQVGDVDNVNLFNGNLALTIPLGGSYPAGGGLTYGLTLVYNSNVWDFQETVDGTGHSYSQGLPQRTSNAGLGWLLTLGRLMAPFTPANDTERWLYLGNDGSEHVFYPTLHVGDADEPGDTPLFQSISYSRDGSYLRMKMLTGGVREIEFPNGQVHRFDSTPRLTQIRDRFGNALNVTYSSLLWTLTDTQGRTHRIYFQNVTQDSQTIQAVNRVELTAFGGATATYNFSYGSATIVRGCPSNDPGLSANVQVPLLTSVSLPDGSSYQMPVADYITELTSTSPVCRSSGAIRGMTLPTLGRLEWTYQNYAFGSTGKIHRQWSPGVATRRTKNAAGGLLGTWTYATNLTGPINSPQDLINTVTDPLGHWTVRYFEPRAGSHEYSLPFSRATTDGAGRYLSTQTYNAAGTLKRTTYVLYESDQRPTAYSDQQELYNVNRREKSSHTVFNDDGNRFADLDRADFDGLGHYRTETTGGNFNAGDVRTTTAAYNPARGTYAYDPVTNQPAPGHNFTMWPTGGNWVLDTFDSRLATEGAVTEFSRFCVDANTGFLQRQRTLKNSGTTENANDVVAVYTPDAAGNLQTEQFFGGDTQSLTANNTTCTMALPAPKYRIDHTYQAGVRATSQYSGTTFLSLDQTIDGPRGLPLNSRDTSGLQTSYEYDALGRLTWVKPASGDGFTEYVYTPASSASALANVLVRRRGTSQTAAVLAQSQVFFDAFGRVWQEKELLPSGAWSVRETLYDAAGHRASVSEVQTGTPNRKTQFLNYDPFGRAATIRPADGLAHDVTFSYFGTRLVDRTIKVATAQGSETSATTTETYDRQGRLWKVIEPSGTAGAAVTTTYSYDVGNRLKQVQTTANGTTQNRFFTYDNRGFLSSETHPEKGAAGNGNVTYSNYDARGHAGRKIDGPNDLTFTYDAAERLSQIQQTGGQVLKTFSYAPSNGTNDWRKGKLQVATRYNFPFYPSLSPKVAVAETYTYGGRQGRVSKKKTLMVYDDVDKETFEQSYTYNPLGAVEHIDYPVCTYLQSCPTTSPRSVDFVYTNGRLTSVPGFATNITYHPNGLFNQITHSNGVIDTQANDPNSMRRPASLSAQLPGLTPNLWSSGAYSYDGAGNVATMGGSYFLYDKVSRLVDGHVYDGPTGGGILRSQTYTYDPFSNLTAVGGDAYAPGRNAPVNAATNRLTGTGVLYDAAGNLTQGPSPSGSCATGNPCYEYDAFNMMTRMRNGGEDWRYIYTAGDERFWAYRFAGAGPSSIWTLRDLDGKVLREYDGYVSWTTARDYIYRDSQLLASSYPGEGDRHFSLDHLGTPRLVTGSSGYTGGTWTGTASNCIPAPADYDGDGDADLSLKCGPIWHFYKDDGSSLKDIWTGGPDTDIPVPADYDGDGDDDPVVFNGGAWHFYDYATGAYHGVWTGTSPGCIPAPADYDGDGNADLSLKCGGAWHFYNDNGTYIKGIWTGALDSQLPVPGDYDGDGDDDVAISNGAAWDFFDYATGTHTNGVWTGTYGTPKPMDYDGDGTTDITVYADGGWHVFADNGAYLQGLWVGLVAGDVPLTKNFKGDRTQEPAVFRGGAWLFFSFAGMPVSRHAYFPFGEEITSPTQDAEQMKFTGQERDLANPASMADDLDYMHARYYNPLPGRFLSVDPTLSLGRAMRRPQGWNRYSYVVGGPLKYVDPNGDTYTLSGCASGNSKQCNHQKALLQSALGDNYSMVTVNRDGTLSLKVSTAAFGSQGTFARGLGGLIASDKTFTLFTDRPDMAPKGGYTESLMGGGANIYLNGKALPATIGGVTETEVSTLVHETGHAVAELGWQFALGLNKSLTRSLLTRCCNEGYAVAFENAWRTERGMSDLRTFYEFPGDILAPTPGLDLFNDNWWP